jgi:hypothetical protein
VPAEPENSGTRGSDACMKSAVSGITETVGRRWQVPAAHSQSVETEK